MPRLDIELTSRLPDGDWTWRAAGARQPKGVVAAELVGESADVGDVLRADTEMGLDGITVVGLTPRRERRQSEVERIEVLGPPTRPGPPPPPAGPGRSGPRSRPPSGRPAPAAGARRGERPGRSERPQRAGRQTDRGRERQPATPPTAEAGEGRAREGPEARSGHPRPRRLQPGRKHRDALLAELPAEQVPVARQLLRGGLPAVRSAVAEQNARAREAGAPEIAPEVLVAMAERVLPRLRAAEWCDRADAVLARPGDVGLRDLRTLVAGSESIAREPAVREVLGQLRDLLDARSTAERQAWEAEIAMNLDEGRVLRALRRSARPPEPGTRFPAELGERLGADAGRSMGADVPADRWEALLAAVASSPVRRAVRPAALPADPPRSLVSAARQAVGRVPGLAPLLGTSVPAPPPPPSRRLPGPPDRERPRRPPPPPPAAPPAAGGPRGGPPSPASLPAARPPETAAPQAPPPATRPVPPAPQRPETAPAGAPAEAAASDGASGDDREDAVLVEELGEAVDQS